MKFTLVTIFTNLIFLFYLIFFFKYNQYFPPPIHNNPGDYFGDFYNTLFWFSQEEMAIGTWHTVYHPLLIIICNFIIRLLGINFDNNFISTMDFKLHYQLDFSLFVIFFFLFNLITLFILFNQINKLNLVKCFFYFLLIVTSPIFIFSVERLNLIFLALLPLYFFIYTKKTYVQLIMLASMVVIKPYLVLISGYFLLKKQLFFFIFVLISIILLLASLDIYNINLVDYVHNFFIFVNEEESISREVLLFNYSTSLINVISSAFNLLILTDFSIYIGVLYINILKYFIIFLVSLPLIYLIIRDLLLNKNISALHYGLLILIIITSFLPSSYLYFFLLYIPFIPFILNQNDKYLTICFALIFSSLNTLIFYNSGQFNLIYTPLEALNHLVFVEYSFCSNILIALCNYFFSLRYLMLNK